MGHACLCLFSWSLCQCGGGWGGGEGGMETQLLATLHSIWKGSSMAANTGFLTLMQRRMSG